MDKKVFYVAPDLTEVELNHEGVLCASDRNGQIDQLEDKYYWADDLWK